MKDLTFKNARRKSNIKPQIKFNSCIFIQIKILKENTIQLVSLVNAFSFEILELENDEVIDRFLFLCLHRQILLVYDQTCQNIDFYTLVFTPLPAG